MSSQEILIIVGVGALTTLLYGLLRTLWFGLRRGKAESTPPAATAGPKTRGEAGDDLVRGADAAYDVEAEAAGGRGGDYCRMIEEVVCRLRRDLRREFERSFWAAIWVNFFFFLLGSAASFLISAGYLMTR